MKKALKAIIVIFIMLFLVLFAFLKYYEVKRLRMQNQTLYEKYIEIRDSTSVTINAYQDTLRILRGK